MKLLMQIVFLLVLMPSTLAIAPVDFVVQNTNALETIIGDVYIYSPQQTVAINEIIPIGVVLAYDGEGTQIQVTLENAPESAVTEAAVGNFSNGEGFYQQEWSFAAQMEGEYFVVISADGETIVRQRLRPDVQLRRLLEESVTPLERLITPTSENTLPVAQEEYSKFVGYNYTEEEFIRAQEEGMSQARVFKQKQTITRVYSDNATEVSTRVLIRIQPITEDTNLEVIEVIPKTVASHVDEIVLEPGTIILRENPVIMWHITGNEVAEVSYELAGNQSITGNTVVIASFDENIQNAGFPWDIVAPAIIIPLIAGIIFFFSKFEPKK